MTDYQMRDSETGRWQNASLTAIVMHEFDATPSEIRKALGVSNAGVIGRVLGKPSA